MVRMLAIARLLAVALLFAATAACSEPRTVDLVMVDDRFIPDHLTFEHDVHYRLHLENHGKETTRSRRRHFSPPPISAIRRFSMRP